MYLKKPVLLAANTGSHKWDFDQEYTPEMTIPATLKAGSALFYGGKLVHGGGANVTTDVKRRVIAVPYNPGILGA